MALQITKGGSRGERSCVRLQIRQGLEPALTLSAYLTHAAARQALRKKAKALGQTAIGGDLTKS
ncbi:MULTISPECIES: hypothetical protein [Pseudomonas]|uniref:hypothetical protein n=1 Tax=Pseudomonas TaxID=286 RepID=UPI00226E602E|nr:hypothetical protein [Pseudomonas putida]WAB96663.1 hypothetical protein OSW16_19220 [Pseudomonas putida]